MKLKKIEWLEILFWILIIILFIMILTRIFGHSATDIQIYLAFFASLLVIVGYIIKLHDSSYDLNREFGEFKIKSLNSFDNIKKDINLIKKKLKV